VKTRKITNFDTTTNKKELFSFVHGIVAYNLRNTNLVIVEILSFL